ncbi:hypothetical protein CEXT_657451 [Caerostris extrusa]|uniref:Uncharacterized protein n=1 Tax=Caerostris extrusa TaxID=172846 RepID=A0AAV4VD63_CAEEX|nr:hypothetical protein CEXT_657451 [Caerostris extrusa]
MLSLWCKGWMSIYVGADAFNAGLEAIVLTRIQSSAPPPPGLYSRPMQSFPASDSIRPRDSIGCRRDNDTICAAFARWRERSAVE